MPNRKLTPAELTNANKLLEEVRSRLQELAGTDGDLLFAYRRKIYKELGYDERSKPVERKKLKAEKRAAQGGLCSICNLRLPQTYCVLDRINAADSYVAENTRLICEECDRKVQAERRFA